MFNRLFRHGAPWLVASARGILEAVALAGLVAAAGAVQDVSAPAELQVYAPVLLALFRLLEGLADQIDPTKARRAP